MYDKNTFSEHLIVNKSKISANATMKCDHYHDFYEIYYYLGNEMNYFIDNKTICVKRHDMVFIDRYMLHKTLYTHQNRGERVLILFHPSILEMLDNDELKSRVKKIFHRKKISFDTSSRESIEEIFNRIYDYYIDSSNTTGIMKAKLGLLELLLNISDKELFINRYYLCHIFKEVTGLSVIEFINTKRLAEAERLLRYSSSSITYICEAVGFNSISHFINLFKKAYLCTPSEFRKSL